ncbi:hypothetical protein [Flavobacterium frigidarium]|uniref:Uncharacterized protein n=1 Tax=Flavobacterium frigidarium TaxID=99286 RepID=A0ABV4KCM6_9FLAO
MSLYILFKVLLTSIVATSVMTLMSYAVSNYLKKLYKEPILLQYFLVSINVGNSSKQRSYISWVLHYAIGLVLLIGYQLYWSLDIIENPWLNLVLLAIVTGMIGVVSWKIIFKICTYKPQIDFKGYYLHIFIVHLIFTMTATFTYLLL